MYLTLAQAIKNISVATGAKSIIVQKSGCKATRKITDQSINKNDKNHSLNVCNLCLFFLKKYAKYMINQNFKNSVGCIVKGIQGMDIHHLAHFSVTHIISTTKSKVRLQKNMYLAWCSKKV